MDEYYHFTEYKNLESISRDGLLPHNGERSISISDSRNIICLSKGKTSAIIMFMALKSFYEHYAGEVGDKLLKDYSSYIKKYETRLKNLRKFSKKDNKLIKSTESYYETFSMLKSQIENIKQYNSFEEYWGSGVYLCIKDVQNVKYNDYNYYDSWVEHKINPEDINVVLLKNKNSEEIIDNKSNIINYFMSITSIEDLCNEFKQTAAVNDSRSEVEGNIREYIDYYNEHEQEFNELKSNYELIEIPLNTYMQFFNREYNLDEEQKIM